MRGTQKYRRKSAWKRRKCADVSICGLRMIQNTQEIKRTLCNWTKQDKMCKFSRKSSFSSYVPQKNRKTNNWFNLFCVSWMWEACGRKRQCNVHGRNTCQARSWRQRYGQKRIAGFVWFFYQYLCNSSAFLRRIWVPRAQPCVGSFNSLWTKRGRLVTYCTRTAHVPGAFMTSQIDQKRIADGRVIATRKCRFIGNYTIS